jgi:hypothetical protein
MDIRYLSLIFLVLFSGCMPAQNKRNGVTESGKKDFTIINDVMHVPVVINGRDMVNMLFDTGFLDGCVFPDSLSYRFCDTIDRLYPGAMGHFDVDTVTIASFPYGSNRIASFDIACPATIAPKYQNDRRLWCFNLDEGRLYIREKDTVHAGAMVFPIEFAMRGDKRMAPFVNIPMTISQGGNSLSIDYLYLLDTGNPFGFVITDPPRELDSFVAGIEHLEIRDLLNLKYRNRRISQFNVNINVDTTLIPDLKCGFDVGPLSIAGDFTKFLPKGSKPVVGTIGVRFLKHYNFILDLKNSRLILSPNHSDFPSKPANGFNFWCDRSGVVNRIVVNSDAYDSGIRLKDTVVEANGVPWKSFSAEEQDSLFYKGTVVKWKFDDKELTIDTKKQLFVKEYNEYEKN